MKRLVLTLGVAIALSAAAAPALARQAAPPKKLDILLYVDTVAGSRPVGVAPRPITCTQSNVFKRGEQIVFRVWGAEAKTGDVLTPETVKYAYVKIPGQPNMKLNWGAHGAVTNRVYFWTAPFVAPPDYPLGTVTFRVVFKTESNKLGQYDQTVTIIPAS